MALGRIALVSVKGIVREVEKEIAGVMVVSLTGAKENGLIELKAYGGTEQDGTPTPTVPVSLVCNNGTLVYQDPELPIGYRRTLGYTCNNNVLRQITDFHLRGSDTVRISFSITAACNVFGCYQGTDATDNYDLYATIISGGKYLRYGNGTYLSYWSSANLGQRFDVVFTPTGTSGMPEDSTWSAMTFESANDLLLGATTLTGTSSKLKGTLYGNFVVDGRLKLIPCERISDHALGYYDTYSQTFFPPTGTPTSLGYDDTYRGLRIEGTTEKLISYGKNMSIGALDNKGYSSTGGLSNSGTFCGNLYKIKTRPGKQYAISYGGFTDVPSGLFISTWKDDGTFNTRQAIAVPQAGYWVYTIPASISEVNFTLYKTGGITIDSGAWLQVEENSIATTHEAPYTGGTVTCEDLFGLTDVFDEQEIINGDITRRVGIKILDGTENYGVSNNCYTVGISGKVSSKTPVLCSHFKYSTKTSSQTEDLTIISFSSNNIGFRYDAKTSAAIFKQWVKDQYDAGDPIIVVYELATETTSSVAGQTLNIKDGVNLIEVSQASLDDLSIYAKYRGTP